MKCPKYLENVGITQGLVFFCLEIAKQGDNVYKFLRGKRYRVGDIDLTYRQVNSLESSNVLETERQDKREWRKFSLVEVVFLNVIRELRKYGIKNDQIKNIKRFLFEEKIHNIHGKVISDLTYGEVAILGTIVSIKTGCMVFSNGDAFFVDSNGFINFNGLYINDDSYIFINLNEIMKEIHKNTKLEERLSKYPNLTTLISNSIMGLMTDKEGEILKVFRNNDYNKITIVKKGKGNINVYGEEAKETGKLTEEDLINLFKSKDYSNITIQRRDGKAVHYSLEDVYKFSGN